MYNFSLFHCKRNTVSSPKRDFLVDTSTIPRFPGEPVSRLWKSERGSQEPFFLHFDRDSRDGLRSELYNGLLMVRGGFPKVFICFDKVQLPFVKEEIHTVKLFPSRLGSGKSVRPFFNLGRTQIGSNSEMISHFQNTQRTLHKGSLIRIRSISRREGGNIRPSLGKGFVQAFSAPTFIQCIQTTIHLLHTFQKSAFSPLHTDQFPDNFLTKKISLGSSQIFIGLIFKVLNVELLTKGDNLLFRNIQKWATH